MDNSLKVGSNEMELVDFRILKEEDGEIYEGIYGINVSKVREIIKMPRLTELPGTPPYIEGIFDLRSVVIPVVNLAKWMGITAPESVEASSRVIITEFNNVLIGFVVHEANLLEDDFSQLSDEELRDETEELRGRYASGESLDELLPEAFAAVREASKRTLGLRHFDVQLMGGGALHLGNIAEMKTGEGKTLVATLAAYLNAIPARGVHIVTVNDYLARYQSELIGRIFRALGMTTGCILSGQTPDERRVQYQADITYGTNNEFGFDYLRDNMALNKTDLVQRGHFFSIVDEVDSILIDEARTPLIISGPASGEANRWFGEFARIAERMSEGTDYEVDLKKRTVGVLEPGIETVEDYLGIDNLYESVNTPLIRSSTMLLRLKRCSKRTKTTSS